MAWLRADGRKGRNVPDEMMQGPLWATAAEFTTVGFVAADRRPLGVPAHPRFSSMENHEYWMGRSSRLDINFADFIQPTAYHCLTLAGQSWSASGSENV